MQAARQLEVASGGRDETRTTLDLFERYMGIAQHHDSITGNNKQAVADDYSLKVSSLSLSPKHKKSYMSSTTGNSWYGGW